MKTGVNAKQSTSTSGSGRLMENLYVSRWRLPIRSKITLPYLFLAAFLAVGAGFLISNIVFDTLEERFRNQLAEVGKLASELMVREEDGLLENLRLLANTQGLAEAILESNPEQLRLLTYGVAVNNQIGAIEILDARGDPVLSMRHRPGGNVEEYEFSAGGDGEIYRSWPFVQSVLANQQDSLGDKYAGFVQPDWGDYFYVSGPVYDANGRFSGVILVGIEVRTVVDDLRQKTLGQITLYHFDGTPIVSSLPDTPAGLDESTARAVLENQNLPQSKTRNILGQRDITVTSLEYTEVLSAWEVRGDADLGIMGAALQKGFFVDPSAWTTFQIGVLVSIAFFLIILIGIYLANLITRPLLGLVEASRTVADGDLNVKVEFETNDEINVLADSFNQMISNLNQSRNDLLQAYDSAILGWSKALELRDKETEGHTQRVTEMAVSLAREMGIEPADLVNLRRGAILHDIGKMGIPDSILQKPDTLNEKEWEIMRKHPLYAYEMLRNIRFLSQSLDIPRYHHENWDGTGYPYGLKGEEIPLAARIFAVVDVWDALTSARPYKDKIPTSESMAIIDQESGQKFDPAVVKAFKQFMVKFLTEPEEQLDPQA